MAVEVVLDASVAAKCLFREDRTDEARSRVESIETLVAPDLIFAELANVAVKYVRRGAATLDEASAALEGAAGLIGQVVATRPLVGRALALAAEHGLSAYDAIYVTLAERRGGRVLTADVKLARRLAGTNLADLVLAL